MSNERSNEEPVAQRKRQVTFLPEIALPASNMVLAYASEAAFKDIGEIEGVALIQKPEGNPQKNLYVIYVDLCFDMGEVKTEIEGLNNISIPDAFK